MDYVDHQILALAGQNRRLVVKNLGRIEQILRSQAPPAMLRTRDFGGLQVPAWSAASRKKGRLLESAIHAVRFGLKTRAASLLKQFLDVDPAPVGAPEDAVFALRNMLAGHPAFSMYSIPYETYMQIPEEIREVDEHPEWGACITGLAEQPVHSHASPPTGFRHSARPLPPADKHSGRSQDAPGS